MEPFTDTVPIQQVCRLAETLPYNHIASARERKKDKKRSLFLYKEKKLTSDLAISDSAQTTSNGGPFTSEFFFTMTGRW